MSDCIVIGAGIVGICCALELQRRGKSVLVIDPNPPGSMTSRGNAGGLGVTEVMPIGSPGLVWQVPGWLLDRYGPLAIEWSHLPAMLGWLWHFRRQCSKALMERNAGALASLLSSCLQDTRELLQQSELSSLLTAQGALTVYPSAESFRRNGLEWQLKIAHGVEAREVDRLAIHDLEPNLRNVHSGWFTPAWCNVTNPHTLATRLADHFCAHGGRIAREQVSDFDLREGRVEAVRTRSGQRHQAARIIIAAGVWSKALCRRLGERVLLEAERGYNTTLPNPGLEIGREIIFGEEKFVASTIDSGIRIGGTAEFARIDAAERPDKADRLLAIAARYLPGLNGEGRENWMGQRPSTPDSLPVIGASSRVDNVIHAFGHGHLGLTMAATTAKLVAAIDAGEPPAIDLQPLHIDRFN